MVEILEPTTPDTIVQFRVARIFFDWPRAKVRIVVVDEDGRETTATYSGPTATTMMNQLNTLDNSTISLHRRIITRLQTDGFLPSGTISGSPD